MVLESISGFYSKLIEDGTERSKDKRESELIKLWNKSFLTLSLLFFLIAVYDLLWVSSLICYSFFLLSAFFCYIIFTDLKFNTLAQTVTYLLLSFVFFYLSSHTGLESGIIFYYIPLVLSLTIFFDIKKNSKGAALVFFFVLFEVFFEIFFDVGTNSPWPMKKSLIFLESMIGSLFMVFWLTHFLLRRQSILIKYYKERTEKRIEEVNADIDKLKLVKDLAEQGSIYFLSKFKSLHPYFCDRLVEIQPTIVASEMEFCAYIKLGFSTKEIAVATRSSVRSVEGKKYRIRKKYNISEKIDIYVWMTNL